MKKPASISTVFTAEFMGSGHFLCEWYEWE